MSAFRSFLRVAIVIIGISAREGGGGLFMREGGVNGWDSMVHVVPTCSIHNTCVCLYMYMYMYIPLLWYTIIINPQCMCEGYSSYSVCVCVCVSVHVYLCLFPSYTVAATYLAHFSPKCMFVNFLMAFQMHVLPVFGIIC